MQLTQWVESARGPGFSPQRCLRYCGSKFLLNAPAGDVGTGEVRTGGSDGQGQSQPQTELEATRDTCLKVNK